MAKRKVDEWLTDDGLLRIQGWARDGLTEEQIAKNIGIHRATLFTWKEKYSDIRDALKESKEIADRIIENALFKSAQGYTVKLKKPVKVKKAKLSEKGYKIAEWEEIEYHDEEVYIKPEVTAQIFWLKNRKPAEWREKKEIEAAVEGINSGVVVIPERAKADEQ